MGCSIKKCTSSIIISLSIMNKREKQCTIVDYWQHKRDFLKQYHTTLKLFDDWSFPTEFSINNQASPFQSLSPRYMFFVGGGNCCYYIPWIMINHQLKFSLCGVVVLAWHKSLWWYRPSLYIGTMIQLIVHKLEPKTGLLLALECLSLF
jgi:hypothetical protein